MCPTSARCTLGLLQIDRWLPTRKDQDPPPGSHVCKASWGVRPVVGILTGGLQGQEGLMCYLFVLVSPTFYQKVWGND